MFVIGLMIGGLIGVFIMCMLQINRDNELQLENDELKMKLNVCGNTSEIWFNKCMIARGQIQKAIKYIEDDYYSKNTTSLDKIGYTCNKLLKVREILKVGDSNE